MYRVRTLATAQLGTIVMVCNTSNECMRLQRNDLEKKDWIYQAEPPRWIAPLQCVVFASRDRDRSHRATGTVRCVPRAHANSG